jgi:hypothetical protein
MRNGQATARSEVQLRFRQSAVAGFVCVLMSVAQATKGGSAEPASDCGLLVPGQVLHIPGPNPILVPGPPGAWDDGVIEAADAFHGDQTFYLYYHGTGQGKGYRLGVATATHPLGPFRKHGNRPILDLGSPGTWDDRNVACGMVLKEGAGKYLMWYSATGTSPVHAKWSIGLATASHPLGPWKKYEGNPVLVDFGYVGGVLKVKDKYHLYAAHPIGSTGPDYSPMSLALAGSPVGPWTRWLKNPVLTAGPKGAWDDGGFSEAEVIEANGLFHMFYGGAKIHPERIRTQESIGYAWSADGFSFVKHPQNPVARREDHPNAAAFAEVHGIFQPPFVYLYHTLRYLAPRTPGDQKRFPFVEDLGVEILATARPFELDMPIIRRAMLGPGQSTLPTDSPPISLRGLNRSAVTAECILDPKASRGLRIQVLRSADGSQWRTAEVFGDDGNAVRTARSTFPLTLDSRFAKIVLENPDPSARMTDLAVTVRLGASD